MKILSIDIRKTTNDKISVTIIKTKTGLSAAIDGITGKKEPPEILMFNNTKELNEWITHQITTLER